MSDGNDPSGGVRPMTICAFLTLALLPFSTSLRTRRSILNLSGMIYCATGRSAMTEVDCYGCFCGPGGEGTPIDDVDRCCKAHDDCYGEVTNNQTCPLGTLQDYLVAYGWSCDEKSRTARCEDDQWVTRWLAGECGKAVCKCDEILANCLKRAEFQFPKPIPPREGFCPSRSCVTF